MPLNKEQLDRLLAPIAKIVGLDTLDFDESGICALVFEGRFTVVLELDEDQQTLHLHTALGTAPDDPQEQLECLRTLMRANLFGGGTQGATLAFDPESDELLLCRSYLVHEADTDTLAIAFERFVHAARLWRQHVQDRFWEGKGGAGTEPRLRKA